MAECLGLKQGQQAVDLHGLSGLEARAAVLCVLSSVQQRAASGQPLEPYLTFITGALPDPQLFTDASVISICYKGPWSNHQTCCGEPYLCVSLHHAWHAVRLLVGADARISAASSRPRKGAVPCLHPCASPGLAMDVEGHISTGQG